MTNNPNNLPEKAGVLILNKQSGVTSHDMVNEIRRLYHTRQVGHTGTLDPMATGVLPILIGRATKAAEYLTAEEKWYAAGLQLGITTDTEDSTGVILTQTATLPNAKEVMEAAQTMVGTIAQIPPMYSALKQNGRKLVDIARSGGVVERQAREIQIYELEITVRKEEKGQYDALVHCSKGTYIRTLCADIGAKLGCGAVMDALVRRKSGTFSIANSYTIEDLQNRTEDQRNALLLPMESLFEPLPFVELTPFFAKLAHCGAEIYQKKIGTAFTASQRVRIADDQGFFALGEVQEYEDGSAIKPIKQFRI